VQIIVFTALFALGLAFVLWLALGFFRQFFAVPQNPLTGQVRDALPGANCGACGFPGCDGYASAVVSGQAGIDRCSVGGKDSVEYLSALMGVSASIRPVIAVLACQGSLDKAPPKGEYVGMKTCRGAKLSAGGTKLCAWGCLGFGDCVQVCKFGALSMGKNGLPLVDYGKCTGCGICVSECPQALLKAIAREERGSVALCSNRNSQRTQVMKTCKAGCIKCGLCEKNCPAKAIVLQNGIPVVNYAACTSCGTCVSKCPTKVLKIIQRDLIPSPA
jgi:Na+-translocating ferredoxin:NAD+ oxidoreductase RNF subunit RnfB